MTLPPEVAGPSRAVIENRGGCKFAIRRKEQIDPPGVMMMSLRKPRSNIALLSIAIAGIVAVPNAGADSVNSPNISMNVDTNRATGIGAGNVPVTVGTITVAETMLPEFTSGDGKLITLKANPGFQFDPSSNITAQSATIGINGGAINAPATITPAGTSNETLTFNFTSGGNANIQDIIRINGIKLRILNAAGAAGPAQSTLSLTTTAVGGAFSNQGIVAATITPGAPNKLEFSIQPGDTQSGANLLPAVKIVDFGGNIIGGNVQTIVLSIETNPGGAPLQGATQRDTLNGIATWVDADNLNITIGGSGYTLRATDSGQTFLTSNTVVSDPFKIIGGAPDHMIFSQQPVDTPAGGDILLAVTVLDELDNPVTLTSTNITIDSAINPGGWPLLPANILTKATVNGVATWSAADHLHINKAVSDYRLSASGAGAPVQSDAFNITPAAANSVRFVQQPTDALQNAAITPPVSVQIVDAFNNQTTDTANVALILKSDCGANLLGNNADAVAGAATFDALKLTEPCTGATLEAASGSLVRDTSTAFNVTADPNAVAPEPNVTPEPNNTPEPNETTDPNATTEPNVVVQPAGAACGACGQGTAMALLPMFLTQFGLRRIVRRNRRNIA